MSPINIVFLLLAVIMMGVIVTKGIRFNDEHRTTEQELDEFYQIKEKEKE